MGGLESGLFLECTVTVPLIWLGIAQWVMQTFYLPEQIVNNACMNMGYSLLTNGEELKGRNVRVHIGVDIFFCDDAEVDMDIDLNLYESGIRGSKGKQK